MRRTIKMFLVLRSGAIWEKILWQKSLENILTCARRSNRNAKANSLIRNGRPQLLSITLIKQAKNLYLCRKFSLSTPCNNQGTLQIPNFVAHQHIKTTSQATEFPKRTCISLNLVQSILSHRGIRIKSVSQPESSWQSFSGITFRSLRVKVVSPFGQNVTASKLTIW